MPRYNNHKKTNRYTQKFKSKAVLLSHLTGVQFKDVAQVPDIHPFMLFRWRKEYREGKIVADKRKKVIKLPREISENDRLGFLKNIGTWDDCAVRYIIVYQDLLERNR